MEEQTFKTIEVRDGIRLTWNCWPASAAKAETVPISCLYNLHQPCIQLDQEPVACQRCQSILCPYSVIDFGSYTWTCTFCGARSNFPKDINIENIPELNEEYSTVEYLQSKSTPFPAIFLLLIDTCTYDQERHELMIRSVQECINQLPEDALVGIVLYGTNINLYSFTDERIKTIYQFSGDFEYSADSLKTMDDVRKFLVPKSEKKEEIMKAIGSLRKDPFPIADGFRASRCSGAVISFAVSFLEKAFTESPVKYVLFTQGPCTYGPGVVQSLEIASTQNLNLSKAGEFYRSLAERMNQAGHSIDIFAITVADIGFEQMQSMTAATGGAIVFAQDFEERIVTRSIEILYRTQDNVMDMGFNARIQVKTSPNLDFKSFIGEGRSRGTGWKVGCLIPTGNMGFTFAANEKSKPNSFGYAQLICQYQRSDRRIVTRITTFSRAFTNDKMEITNSFDQEAACITQARFFCMQPYENIFDLETAIDKHLIRFTRKYGTWERNNPGSVTLPTEMSYYPHFMFYFRRSFIIQKDGISSDESSYFKTLLFKLRPDDALRIIKPFLVSFHYQGDVQPVDLDPSVLHDDCMLVLDSFHNILLWNGNDIEMWKKQKLDNQPEFKFFKQALTEAHSYVKELTEERFPAPQFKETSAGKSQERILLTHMTLNSSQTLSSQKIDFQKFYHALCKHIVFHE